MSAYPILSSSILLIDLTYKLFVTIELSKIPKHQKYRTIPVLVYVVVQRYEFLLYLRGKHEAIYTLQ